MGSNYPTSQEFHPQKQFSEDDQEEIPTCLICTGEIKYYGIPEKCNHNLICWTCMLKQRLKMGHKECPACKETSERVLITNDANAKINNWQGQWIEDPETGIVYAEAGIKSEVQRKIGLHCLLCEEKGARDGYPVTRKFPTIKALREHLVKQHQRDYCELCVEQKPVLMFEQQLYRYEPL